MVSRRLNGLLSQLTATYNFRYEEPTVYCYEVQSRLPFTKDTEFSPLSLPDPKQKKCQMLQLQTNTTRGLRVVWRALKVYNPEAFVIISDNPSVIKQVLERWLQYWPCIRWFRCYHTIPLRPPSTRMLLSTLRRLDCSASRENLLLLRDLFGTVNRLEYLCLKGEMEANTFAAAVQSSHCKISHLCLLDMPYTLHNCLQTLVHCDTVTQLEMNHVAAIHLKLMDRLVSEDRFPTIQTLMTSRLNPDMVREEFAVLKETFKKKRGSAVFLVMS